MQSKNFIWVTFQKEGIHKYPAALDDDRLHEVRFLGYPHRHIFHFKVEIEVFHDDRDTLYSDNKYYPYSKLNFIITSNCIIFPSITNNNISIFDSLNDLPIRKIKYNINCEASLIECGGLHCLSMNI